MNYVEQQAILEAIEEIALGTWSANLGAQRFFTSHGFIGFTVAFRKTLQRASRERPSRGMIMTVLMFRNTVLALNAAPEKAAQD